MPALQRLALVVIHLALPASEREWIIGDVMEEFELIARRDGAAAANRWLRHEAIRAAAGAYRLRAVLGRPATPPRGESPMRNLFQDVRYTGRLLRRSPGFTAVAALTLAVGIGANAAIFSIVHAVLLAPLPYANPDQLVRLYDASEEEPRWPMAPGNFHEYRSHARSLEALAAYERGDLQLEGERPEPLRGMRVTPGFFSVLGWSPILGRDFRPDEEAPGGEDVAILSHGLWQRRFSSDPSVVGQGLTLSGRPFRIVGVLPAGFQHVGSTYRSYPHGNTVDIWWVRTLRPVPLPQDRNQHYLNVVGRLRSDVTFARAQQELTSIAERLAREYPNSNGSWRVRLAPLREEIVGATAPILLMLLAAVQLVLLLACVNVAGLLVGRASQRTREIGVRAALGATRARLVRQLVVESLVLAAGGGAIGVAFAAAAVRALPLIAPADMPRLDGLTLQWTVVLYAVGMMGVTALLFGLLPAVQLARSAVNDTLRGGGRGVTAGSNPRLRSTLVAAEIALAFLLVAGAGLLFRSFENLTASEPGFRSAGVLTARVGLPQARYRNTAEAAAFFERLRDRIAAAT